MSYCVFIQLETFAFKLLECNKILTLYKVKKNPVNSPGDLISYAPAVKASFISHFRTDCSSQQ